MLNIHFVQHSPNLFVALVGIFALLVGSFLNVVIARLPITLKRDWRKDCYEYLNLTVPESEQGLSVQKFNLLLPRSHCPNCKNTLRIIDNIPIISYLILRGSCYFCKQKISIKYPLIEAITAVLCMLTAAKYGVTWQSLAACLFTCILIVQSGIDFEHKMIPDEITLPMIWLALLLSLHNIFANSHSSIIGASLGYMILYGIYWIFYLSTNKEGMGYGDFKLLAMLGAWLGWQALPFIIIFSSALGALSGITLILLSIIDRNTRIPFGPFLALAGWLALMYGSQINQWYLEYARLY